MKNKFIVMLCLLCVSSGVYARSYPVLFIADTVVTAKAAYHEVVVLDQRTGKQYVGSMREGYKHSGLVAAYPLDSMLRTFALDLVAPAAAKDSQTLVVALKHIVVEEKTNTDFTIGNIYLDADFYLGAGQRYTRVAAIDTLVEFQMKASKPEFLSFVFSHLFSRYLYALATAPVPEGLPVYDMQQVQAMDSVVRSRYPVYVEAPRKGVYYTLAEFLNNQPSDTVFAHDHVNCNEVISEFFYLRPQPKKNRLSLSDTTCFAVFNGRKWYMPYGKSFQEVLVKDGDFYYKGKDQGLVQTGAAAPYYMAGFGLVGAVASVATTAIYNGIADGRNARNPERQGKAVFRYKLDPERGGGIRTERLE